MQKCSICEKPIYGHPQVKSGQQIVCGSCPLMKSQGGPTGKSLFEVRLDLAKVVTKQHPNVSEGAMNHLNITSNVRNRTILLDGKYPVVFDAKGEGKLPVHLRELFEREMRMKPGRFSIVEEVPVVVAPEPAMATSAVNEEPRSEKIEEVPTAKVDLSFLTDTPKSEVKKASKKRLKEQSNGS